jgi:hypothetical protein
MYNKYNTLIYADAKKQAPKALEIAKIEWILTYFQILVINMVFKDMDKRIKH